LIDEKIENELPQMLKWEKNVRKWE